MYDCAMFFGRLKVGMSFEYKNILYTKYDEGNACYLAKGGAVKWKKFNKMTTVLSSDF